jgi:hypothetical protein
MNIDIHNKIFIIIFIEISLQYTRPRSPKTLARITNLIGSSPICQALINTHLSRVKINAFTHPTIKPFLIDYLPMIEF